MRVSRVAVHPELGAPMIAPHLGRRVDLTVFNAVAGQVTPLLRHIRRASMVTVMWL